MDFLKAFPQKNGVYYLTPHQSTFESAYLKLREKEGRVHTDEQVRVLPQIPVGHQHHKEWQMRAQSTKRILHYLQEQNISGNLLDLGCGNGWFSRDLAKREQHQVLSVDVNRLELEQAARLFSCPNCQFVYGDILADVWPAKQFKLIVLNSCIQYFPSLPPLLDRLQNLLTSNGEIHVLDSPFYKEEEIPAARQRSLLYYEQMEAADMAVNYFHHSWSALAPYSYEVLYDPNTLFRKIGRKLGQLHSPFPWLRIKAI